MLGGLHASPTGAPAYPPLTMLKALLLQQWYGLSDPGLKEALSDRLSFRRFCGLPLDTDVPDHSTISRFRNALRQDDLDRQIFDEVNRQIDRRGLILRHGTLIDASLIPAVNPPRKPKTPPPPGQGTMSRARPRNTTHFIPLCTAMNLKRDDRAMLKLTRPAHRMPATPMPHAKRQIADPTGWLQRAI